jgi:squalene-hopene/tetraprenyl-beta-curcumene cyclase
VGTAMSETRTRSDSGAAARRWGRAGAPARSAAPAPADDLDRAIARATEHLLGRQRPDGSWWARLHSNVCMEAEFVFLAHCLGRREADLERRIARHLLATQGEDGGWPIYPGGPGDLNATVEAYQALKLVAPEGAAGALDRARAFALAHGGVPGTRVFTRIWLALLGQYEWDRLPVVPPEIVLLPPWMPLNLYEFASWARATVVPITLLMARRPRFPVPPEARVDELWPARPVRRPVRRGGWEAVFRALDRVLRAYGHLPWQPGRAAAERRALAWILEHQEADGSWGGIQPPWVYSLLALKVLGMEDHPAFRRGWEGLLAYGVEEPDGRWWLQPSISPVWDTALATWALRQAGVPADHPALVRAGTWLLDRQVLEPGDWRVRRPRATPGGWPFEWDNRHYPDVDDTAIVLLALRGVALPEQARRRAALTRGFRWLVAMQSRNGGWAAYDADQLRTLVARIPFSDFGASTDPPSEDVTGHALECLGAFGYDEAFAPVRRAVAYLRRVQDPDGSWFGRWGVNHVYGTGAVLPGLAAVGVDMRAPWVQAAADWLEAHQGEDGGWGESCASYEDPAWRGRGPSTPSQTAWALLGLVAAGRARGAAAERGVRHLLERQRPDGGWDEHLYTGTGFPRDFYLGYELYRDVFPTLALARYRRALRGRST